METAKNNIINLNTKVICSKARSWAHLSLLTETIDIFLRKMNLFNPDAPVPETWFPTLRYISWAYDIKWAQHYRTDGTKWKRVKQHDNRQVALDIVNFFYDEFAEPIHKCNEFFIMREVVEKNKEIYTIVSLKNNTYLRYLIPDLRKFTDAYKLGPRWELGYRIRHCSMVTFNSKKSSDEAHDDFYISMLENYFIDVTHDEIQNEITKYVIQKRNLKPKAQKIIILPL